MPRIKLASWYGDKAPGAEVDVDEVTAKALRRDGLVAEVVVQSEAAPPPEQTEAPDGEPAEPQSAAGRKRR